MIAPSWFLAAAVIVIIAAPIVARFMRTGRPAGAADTVVAVAVSVALAVLLGLSVLAHELGHCVAAAHFGIGVEEVRLYLVGGVSQLDRPPASAKEESLVAAAGPAVSAVVALACWGLLALTERYTVGWLIAGELALANGIVAVFNILPALPLDGGRVLRAAIWAIGGAPRLGTIAGVVGGFVVAAALLAWAGVTLAGLRQPGLLLAAIIAAMALFVAAGAWAEWPRRTGWPPGMTMSSVMRPVSTLRWGEPQSATGPRADAVILVDTNGRPLGLADPQASDSSSVSVIPLEPEMIVVPGDVPERIVERMVASSLPYVAVTDGAGRIEGVVMRADVERVLQGRRG